MSSFELLELFGVTVVDDTDTRVRTVRVDFAPEQGALAQAMRGGERPEWQQMLAQVANISAVERAANFPDMQADIYGERFFFSVAKMREFEIEREQQAEEEQRLRSEGDGFMSMWGEEVNA